MKNIISFAFVFFFLLQYGVGGHIHISNEEEMELEAQLKILNKPATKTFQTKDGTYDCVDLRKQPAFDHPMLINHKLQMKPTHQPELFISRSSLIKKGSQVKIMEIDCPQGTVPIRRTKKEDIKRSKYFSKYFTSNIHQERVGFPGQHVVALKPSAKATYYGVYSDISVHSLQVRDDQYTTAQMWIQNGPSNQYTSLQAGWMVSPYLAGNNGTRLFIYWTTDNSKTGCFNHLCPGFVQVHPRIMPGSFIVPSSTYDGVQYEIGISVSQDKITGNWWLACQNISLGYWPKDIVPQLNEGASLVGWGGLAVGSPNGDSPPMGNGHFPNGEYKKACGIRNVQIVDSSSHFVIPNEHGMQSIIESPECYGLEYHGYEKYRGISFLFGGPGGKCKV